MSTSLQKLRIHALLMRCQEIQESKIRKIHFINESINHVRVLGVGMDFGQVLIINKPIEHKKDILFKNDYNKIFKQNDIHINEEILPSKYFGKPKNNFKK